MPFALIIIGLALLITAVRGTTGAFFTLVKGDFTGNGNFIYWLVAILVIGAVGYIKKLQPISDMMLALVLIVLFLKSGTGFFDQFTKQIANPIGVSSPQSGSSSLTSGTMNNLLFNSTPNVNDIVNLGKSGLGDLFSSGTGTQSQGTSLSNLFGNSTPNVNDLMGLFNSGN